MKIYPEEYEFFKSIKTNGAAMFVCSSNNIYIKQRLRKILRSLGVEKTIAISTKVESIIGWMIGKYSAKRLSEEIFQDAKQHQIPYLGGTLNTSFEENQSELEHVLNFIKPKTKISKEGLDKLFKSNLITEAKYHQLLQEIK